MDIARIVDLTLPLDERTQVYPGDPEPRIEPAATIRDHGYNVLSLHLGSHSGTHVDAPFHVIAGGERLEGLGLGPFVGRGVLVDATGLGPGEPIEWDRVAPSADRLGPGSILLLHTGWSELHHGTDRYLQHPHLEPAAAERVLGLGVRTIAIDALNPDPTTSDDAAALPVHRLVLGAGGVIAENLTNLSAIREREPLVFLLPIRLGGEADGAPCRAIAVDLEP